MSQILQHYSNQFTSKRASVPVTVFTDSLPKINPLLSLSKSSLPRIFWSRLVKHSSPILLIALIRSLSFCYTPHDDYQDLASFLLTQCASQEQWELINQVLCWMKKNVPHSALVFSNLLSLINVIIM